MVDHVEAVVVAPCGDGVAVGRSNDGKFVKDGLVLEHLAQFALQTLVDVDGRKRFLGVADVPNLDCQKITGNDVFSLLGEFTS